MKNFSVMIETWKVEQKNNIYNCKDVDSSEVLFDTKEEALKHFSNLEPAELNYDEGIPTSFEVLTVWENEIINEEINSKSSLETKHSLTDEDIELINY